MDYVVLFEELSTDPLGRGYAGMDDEQAADDLNIVYRTRPRASITGDDAFQATNGPEFVGLAAASRTLWLAFCGRDIINPYGQANVDLVVWLFGGGSTTVANLQDLRMEDVSRGVELDLGIVKPGHVHDARLLGA